MEELFLDEHLAASAKILAKSMEEKKICLYITGLAATGKSAVAEIISRLSGVPIVDSGLPFRLAAYLCSQIPVALQEMKLLDTLLSAHRVQVINGGYRIFSGDRDITERLHTVEVDDYVPQIASNTIIREKVLLFLRNTTVAPAIVAGRGATEPLTSGPLLQIELKTDFEERVSRRAEQFSLPIETVRPSMQNRDNRDLNGPARYPSTESIENTKLTLEETVAQVIIRATERIKELHGFRTFRRQPLNNNIVAQNPLLNKVWEVMETPVLAIECNQGVPESHSRGRYLLNLSRFSSDEIFGTDIPSEYKWSHETFPTSLSTNLPHPNISLLRAEAERTVSERRAAIEKFFGETHLSRVFLEPTIRENARRIGKRVVTTNKAGVSQYFEMRDASRELGLAIENHLHYLGEARLDSTHRLVFVEESSELPVLYVSFAPNTRRYLEPLLWAFELRMEEVAVAVRAYGSPRCPSNAMGIFMRMACKRVKDDFPHLKAILTDINPNWGYSGVSFREAGFIDVGIKHAPTHFSGDTYVSRRGFENQKQDATTTNKLSLAPTIIMINPMGSTDLEGKIKAEINSGLYIIPRILYDKR